jgi:2,3-dihydro-2,3-dihydroxybenzoate dehydrogenase
MHASLGVTIVTGAASGIGAAVAEALIALGGRVAAIDLDERGLAERAAALGPSFVGHALDVRDDALVTDAIDRIDAEQGPIRGLVYAAGSLWLGELCAPTTERTALRQLLEVHVESLWGFAHAVVPHLVRHGGGAIVTVASNAAGTPRSGMGFYCASKAASAMLTRCLGLELARQGVRCNVVSPGSTQTPMLERMLGDGAVQRVVDGDPQTFRLGIPLGRVASPADVADAVVFLLSDRSRHITLQELRIDGGATL